MRCNQASKTPLGLRSNAPDPALYRTWDRNMMITVFWEGLAVYLPLTKPSQGIV
jgi:hypothetical protein